MNKLCLENAGPQISLVHRHRRRAIQYSIKYRFKYWHQFKMFTFSLHSIALRDRFNHDDILQIYYYCYVMDRLFNSVFIIAYIVIIVY